MLLVGKLVLPNSSKDALQVHLGASLRREQNYRGRIFDSPCDNFLRVSASRVWPSSLMSVVKMLGKQLLAVQSASCLLLTRTWALAAWNCLYVEEEVFLLVSSNSEEGKQHRSEQPSRHCS